MVVLIYVLGAISTGIGVALIGFGIPVNEFSFGNTLIIAGTIAVGSGLILIALGAAVAHLQRISDALSVQSMRPGRSPEVFEAPGSRVSAAFTRVPFPPRPKSDMSGPEPHPSTARSFDVESDETDRNGVPVAPVLRNPDEIVIAADDAVEAPLSPRPPAKSEMAEDAKVELPRSYAAAAATERQPDSAMDTSWRSVPRSSARPAAGLFDAMWSPQDRRSKSPATDEPVMKQEPAAVPASKREGEVRTVAILKSGVVDGMGYTLYVDGSIEAQLPQGTLRFASINELRQHLEKNS